MARAAIAGYLARASSTPDFEVVVCLNDRRVLSAISLKYYMRQHVQKRARAIAAEKHWNARFEATYAIIKPMASDPPAVIDSAVRA